jgi:nitroreductase
MNESDRFEAVERVIRERRTVHLFRPEPPPDEWVRGALELARWAPNHHHTEPWRFHWLGPQTAAAVVRLNTELVRQSKGDAAAAAKEAQWSTVPGWIVVTSTRDADPVREREDYAACCCAIHSFSLALWARGVGVKWSTGAVTRHPDFFRLLELPPDRHHVIGLLWYGFPQSVPEQKRRPLDEVLSRLP